MTHKTARILTITGSVIGFVLSFAAFILILSIRSQKGGDLGDVTNGIASLFLAAHILTNLTVSIPSFSLVIGRYEPKNGSYMAITVLSILGLMSFVPNAIITLIGGIIGLKTNQSTSSK